MKIILATPQGFCFGVEHALLKLSQTLEKFSPPVYVLNPIVHNEFVVGDFEKRGAIFIEDIDEYKPTPAPLVISAHGVGSATLQTLQKRGIPILNLTCPLVTLIHNEIKHNAAAGLQTIVIGSAPDHSEIKGILGQVPKTAALFIKTIDQAQHITPQDPEKLAYVTQTTLSLDATRPIIDILKKRFPKIKNRRESNICRATQERQTAVKELLTRGNIDVTLIVGSKMSSNVKKLYETAAAQNKCPAYAIESAQDIDRTWFPANATIGITSGASTPKHLVNDIMAFLNTLHKENAS
ncbi:MAG: 4-hydroxy-3-methylbut-2-enyl diphosphate reductase [Lactobacillales bacterium]|jgi:4-hydroxy-3-methylbut-2-enyl diphosphate reductase|nr:4-hydroxy-3-methylbut-2-enyl diphosphate reductase [Lactobacillales bacterium]